MPELLTPDNNGPGPSLHAVDAAPKLSEMKEDGPFTSLIANFRDVFFPEKLPPLVLESKPIAVVDPMATHMSKKSIALSITFYALLFLLLAFFLRKAVQIVAPKAELTAINVPIPPPPVAPKTEAIGGGGGQHDVGPVTQGHLPKLAQTQIVPPKAPPTVAPKLAVEPTVVVQKDLKLADNNLPNLGAPNSSLKGFSMGNGSGSGIGSGNGNGIGPGSGGNIGGGVMHVGGSVKPPSVIHQVDPEFSEEARKAKFSGNVLVALDINQQGLPTHVHCVRDIGMGLCDKAVEAVRQYTFHPATQNGKPVTVDMNVEVNFQIF
jgi:protein TonB